MANIFGFTDTWNAVGTVFDCIKCTVTNTASAAGSDLLDLSITGGAQIRFIKTGVLSLSDGTHTGTITPSGTTGLTLSGPTVVNGQFSLPNFSLREYNALTGTTEAIDLRFPTEHRSGAPWVIWSNTTNFGGAAPDENDALFGIGFNAIAGGTKIVNTGGVSGARKQFIQIEHDYYQTPADSASRLDELWYGSEDDAGTFDRIFQINYRPSDGAATNLWTGTHQYYADGSLASGDHVRIQNTSVRLPKNGLLQQLGQDDSTNYTLIGLNTDDHIALGRPTKVGNLFFADTDNNEVSVGGSPFQTAIFQVTSSGLTANGAAGIHNTVAITPTNGVTIYGARHVVTQGAGGTAGGTIIGEILSIDSTGANKPSLMVGVQAGTTNQTTAGTVSQMTGFASAPAVIGAGVVATNVTHFQANDVFVSSGSAGTQYGFYAAAMTSAGTNWAFYSAGTTPSQFGGTLQALAYKVANTQVVGARVIDARIDDTINSGDATTDGVIDAIRDALITHGLIAAA